MEIKSRKFTYEEVDGKTILTVFDTIEVDNYNLLERVEIMAYIRCMDLTEVSRRFGSDQVGNFKKKLLNAKLSNDDYLKLAEILNVKYVNKVVFYNDYEIENVSNSYLIKESCLTVDKSLMDVSKHLGITRQALNIRLNTDKFTHEEMDEIIHIIGGKYYNYFDMEGAKI